MEYKTILFESKGGIGVVTINRPDVLNALNHDIIDELELVFQKIANEDSVRCVIVTGAGRSFIAGADIAMMSNMQGIEGRDYVLRGQGVMNLIENLEKPVFAAINGFALGGGLELAMACDFRIASEKAKFAQPEVNLGIIPGYGGTQRLPRLVGKGMAKFLTLSAIMIDAAEAFRIGLVEKVVPAEELMSYCEELAKTIVSKSPIGLKMAKKAINVGTKIDQISAIDFEAECYGYCFYTEDRNEGMAAFLEKREANFKNK